MKQAIVMMMLLCMTAIGYTQAQTAPAKGPNAPKFQFKEDTYDFGKVPEGPIAEHVFEFKNTGKEPLIITNVNASCGCTMPEWSKDPVLPGKKGKITVRFTTAGRGNQPFIKDIFVTSNAATPKERYELHIKGFVTLADDGSDKAKK